MVKIKRVYDSPTADDGQRILADRLWPRGLRKEAAALDAWNKDVAPSPQLRQWFGHRPERFEEFSQKYQEELGRNDAAQQLRDTYRRDPSATITLLYAAKDEHCNHAVVLQRFMEE